MKKRRNRYKEYRIRMKDYCNGKQWIKFHNANEAARLQCEGFVLYEP
jgi:hypothetical protein